jgi:phage terminase large subunit
LKRVQEELNLSDAQIASEYEMEFSSAVDSAVFDFGLVMQAQVSELPQYEHSRAHVIYIGVDPAGQGKDFAVAVALQATKENECTVYTVIKIYRKRIGVSEQHLSAIGEMIAKLDPLRTTIESNSMGQVWLEHLAGLRYSSPIEGFSTTASSKPVLIGRLQIALERGVLRIPKGPIIDELLAYRRTDSGKLEAGGNAHDDCVIALALALHSAGFNQLE